MTESLKTRVYHLRYKHKQLMDAWVEASSLQAAADVGRAWCAQHPGYTYVAVREAIVADESILEPPKPEGAAVAVERPKGKPGRVGE